MKSVAKVLLSLLFLSVIIMFIFFNYLARKTNQPFYYYPRLFFQALKNPNLSPDFSFLILGLDYRDDTLEQTQTTDTIIFGHLNSSKLTVSLVSLPRDLWNYSSSSKINQIYPVSLSKASPLTSIKEQFLPIIGQPIDRVLVINTDTLAKIIDIFGGVDVYLPQAYRDTHFPNPAYIENPSPQIPTFITVEFPVGWNHIDSTNIDFFVRSRKGGETAETGGTDLGRIHRQQLLLDSLFKKIKTDSSILEFDTLVKLYQLFHQELFTDITDNDLFSLILHYRRQLLNLSLQRFEVPVGANPQSSPIYDPGKLVYGQWLFLPSDKGYQQLHQFIKDRLL